MSPSSCWIPSVKSFNNRTIVWYVVKSVMSVLRWTNFRWIFTSSLSSVLSEQKRVMHWGNQDVLSTQNITSWERNIFHHHRLPLRRNSLLHRADSLRSEFTKSVRSMLCKRFPVIQVEIRKCSDGQIKLNPTWAWGNGRECTEIKSKN